ncbi:aldehyde dehydrogenase (NADP(+)) [Pacificimonas flava]|uniref:Aldehyde dehydrogenase (NADP(+)) n=2 Tax=Pacificimonas TaxID=1960290 RepID=A0A219B2P7_9SPHN|nr:MULTISPECIES: aldehyde dehydrogenase (NADP(+)) [Pacificimonas]MBZ6377700.1 aldehyde dehydrogenase (NADP(+)) [Pacificimonas aurantium]OWV32620.1 aldehyde dehydrogenase (NADP(+)) [Pacificimonas flava]
MISGSVFVGASEEQSGDKFRGVNPATGETLSPDFCAATGDQVARACKLADEAFPVFSALAPPDRAAFLERAADEIMALGDELIERSTAESGLPRARLEGERGRTVGQLRMFAAHLKKGEWLHVAINPAMPDRDPLPRADLRRRHVAVGPVAVFGASNFPLAFSVAGGDTASGLAAGCPVVVKGHPAHPGTGELVARALRTAVAACGLPDGVFSYLPGPSNELGAALVSDPHIRAVGFTGSRPGGLALMRVASARPVPIPVFAEMSSINPVLLLPGALAARADALGEAFVGSLTLGSGQFCTNPGLVLALRGEALDRFLASAAKALEGAPPTPMLTAGIHDSYGGGVATLDAHKDVTAVGRSAETGGVNCAQPALYSCTAKAFLSDPALGAEVFGPASLVVACDSLDEMAAMIEGLEGQLTATVHLEDDDKSALAELLPKLERKAGRILANGWPTGVEVCDAMVHGGPYPATSDGQSTSVGTLAIERFLRPVCFQDIPDDLLPPPLRNANPWNVPRHVDGDPKRT